jgi:hypothetical protein
MWGMAESSRGLTHEEIVENARKGGAARAQQQLEEIEAGTWQNPADAPGAQEKLSRSRRHADNPLLHWAFEKLKQGLSVSDLTEAEAEAHWRYGRRRYRMRRTEICEWRREWYKNQHHRGKGAEERV